MSFLKISDPKKRDFIVEEFLKTKKNIQDSFLSERLGDIDIHREMSKLFKPITEAQTDVKESLLALTSTFTPKEAIIRLFDNQDEIMQLNLSPIQLLEEMGKNQTGKSDIECNFYESASDVLDPKELSSDKKNLMVFDDLLLERQNKCEAYYTRGRHSNVDCFYLAQNYFRLPRQTIRENANFICLFRQDLKNINHIYNDHVSCDMSKEEFRNLCKTAWEKSHGFVVVDLSSKKNKGKYRIGLDVFYIPN